MTESVVPFNETQVENIYTVTNSILNCNDKVLLVAVKVTAINTFVLASKGMINSVGVHLYKNSWICMINRLSILRVIKR